MPGRATIRLNAKELNCYGQLVAELAEKGYQIAHNSRVEVCLLSPYRPKPSTDISAIIKKLERDIAINGSRKVGKGDLCKILGISMPTLNAWIRRYWGVPADDRREIRKWFYRKMDINEVKNKLSEMTLLCNQITPNVTKIRLDLRVNS